jgi:hypothetical protein
VKNMQSRIKVDKALLIKSIQDRLARKNKQHDENRLRHTNDMATYKTELAAWQKKLKAATVKAVQTASPERLGSNLGHRYNGDPVSVNISLGMDVGTQPSRPQDPNGGQTKEGYTAGERQALKTLSLSPDAVVSINSNDYAAFIDY